MNISSSLLQNTVDEFAKFPGIGKKTALRLALFLLKRDKDDIEHFVETISKMSHEISFCERCGNISDGKQCNICKQEGRNKDTLCVVEDIKDIISIENTGQYNGQYHVLGGVISPLDGVGPDQLSIDKLLNRVRDEEIKEMIFALSPNIQGDTTIYYITRKLPTKEIKITTIARGIAFGGELEYADELTLGRSITNRMPVDSYVGNHG